MRWYSAIPIAVLLVVSGCADRGAVDPDAVTPGRDNVIISADHRVTVEIPGDAVTRPGHLTIDPIEGAEGLRGWSIELADTTLVGSAKIRFKVGELIDGEPTPLVTYASSENGERHFATDVVMEGDEVVVTTDHFSNWFADRWKDIRDGATSFLSKGIDFIARDGSYVQPSCPDEQKARDRGFTVTSDDGSRIAWCLGLDNDVPVLKANNNRGYGVSAEYTPGLDVVRAKQNDLIALLADRMKWPPSKDGNEVQLVAPGDPIEFELAVPAKRATEGVMFKPDPGAYLFTALELAVETYAMTLQRTGVGDAKDKIIAAIKGAGCIDSFDELTDTEFSGPEDVAPFFTRALEMSLDCAEMSVDKLDIGPINEFIVAPLVWVLSALRTAVAGIVATAESFDFDGYQIRVNYPESMLRRTEIVNVVAVDSADDPAPGWRPARTGTRSIPCSYARPASSSVGQDIVQCDVNADGAFACWVHADRQSLTCAIDVWEKQYYSLRSQTKIGTIGSSDEPGPEWIELDDGSKCMLRHGGSWGGRSDGLVGGYACEGTNSVVLTESSGPIIDRTSAMWTVKVGPLGAPDEDFPPPETRAVTKAYFTASP